VCNEGITLLYLPPTHEPYLPLLPSCKASPPFGWYSLRLPTKGWPGLVEPGGWSHTEINVPHRELNPDTVTHLSTNLARRWLTSLIEANCANHYARPPQLHCTYGNKPPRRPKLTDRYMDGGCRCIPNSALSASRFSLYTWSTFWMLRIYSTKHTATQCKSVQQHFRSEHLSPSTTVRLYEYWDRTSTFLQCAAPAVWYRNKDTIAVKYRTSRWLINSEEFMSNKNAAA